MAPDYKTYLAVNVLNEGSIITYRSLSHEFKIHANAAKKILADFHASQNATKPLSVHATYLVSGFQEYSSLDTVTVTNGVVEPVTGSKASADTDGDVPMPSSPFMSSSAPQVTSAPPVLRRVLTLVREEGLTAVKAKYNEVTAVHVYSLESVSPKDIQVLAQPNRQIEQKSGEEDPLEYFKLYGVIQNPNVKRRTMHQAGAASKIAAPITTAKADASSTSNQPAAAAFRPTAKANSKPAPLKKETSDLFKSFAKAKPKAAAKADAAQDVAMQDAFSDDDNAAADAAEPAPKPDMTSTKIKQERETREQRLRDLMNADDAPAPKGKDDGDAEMTDEADEPEAEPEPEPQPVDEPALEQAAPAPVKEEEPQVTVSGGRRRGKRKVMKKVTMKDEEGYLITKEEAAWESFSEDEAPAAKSKPAVSASSGKPKSSGGAKGQGKIMSFFGKK